MKRLLCLLVLALSLATSFAAEVMVCEEAEVARDMTEHDLKEYVDKYTSGLQIFTGWAGYFLEGDGFFNSGTKPSKSSMKRYFCYVKDTVKGTKHLVSLIALHADGDDMVLDCFVSVSGWGSKSLGALIQNVYGGSLKVKFVSTPQAATFYNKLAGLTREMQTTGLAGREYDTGYKYTGTITTTNGHLDYIPHFIVKLMKNKEHEVVDCFAYKITKFNVHVGEFNTFEEENADDFLFFNTIDALSTDDQVKDCLREYNPEKVKTKVVDKQLSEITGLKLPNEKFRQVKTAALNRLRMRTDRKRRN